MAVPVIVEVELNELLHSYLQDAITGERDGIHERAREAAAVARAEQAIAERIARKHQAEHDKIQDVYDQMGQTGVAAAEITALTGLKVSSALPKIKSIMAAAQDGRTIVKEKQHGIIMYYLRDPSPPAPVEPAALFAS